MAGLIPFNKRRDLATRDSGIDEFYNMLDDFFRSDWPFRRSLEDDTFKLDVIDNGNEYIIEAEVPGIDKKDINVEMVDNRLEISITKDESKEEKDKNYIHKERYYSSMSRSIYLADAKSEGLKAKLENGILKITIPKEEIKENKTKIEIE